MINAVPYVFLDQYSKKGIRFSNAYSHSSHTKISVASLFTGLVPSSHQVRTASLTTGSDILGDSVETLAEILKKRGYLTAGFIANPHVTSQQGFGQGFDLYKYFFWENINARTLNENVLSWLSKKTESPYFIYLHYMDVHLPYNPPLPYKHLYTEEREDLKPLRINGPPPYAIDQETIEYSVALYDAQINFWDDCLSQFFEKLKKRGLLENTIVVIVADHGEEFNEHKGFGHGFTVYSEMLHVPMYFVFENKLPGGVVRNDLARLIDVIPTLCGLSGIDTDGMNLEGVDLFDKENSQGRNNDRIVFSETYQGKEPLSVRTAVYQLIFNRNLKNWEFYSLKEDPIEEKDIYSKTDIQEITEMKKLLSIYMRGKNPDLRYRSKEIDAKTKEELRSLGYVQ